MNSKEYLEAEGLDYIFNFNKGGEENHGAYDSVSGTLKEPFPIQYDDLARLYRLIRMRKPFTVLEFGIGFSTAVISMALSKNEEEWLKLPSRPIIRNRHLFQLYSVDTSKKWIINTKKMLNEELRGRTHFSYSEVEVGLYRDQICHYYKNLPDIVPDFIYLDGPHPKEVKGKINGLSFQCDERTVMAADLLRMESILLPGTFILIDGRTNNSRFLQRNFTRNFRYNWDKNSDVSTFELMEEKLGPYNHFGYELY